MEKEINKFHALQLFTDTFSAETVHLTNEKIGIYIRLICFCWTKNARMFTNDSAYRICQCIDDKCKRKVDEVLIEFFKKNGISGNTTYWLHKRLTAEHEYLTAKYKARSEAGRKGGLAKSDNASSKIIAPIPIPSPIPNKQLAVAFEEFWSLLHYKKGSKKLASQRYLKECRDSDPKVIAESFNKYASKIQDKQYCAQVSTFLNQRRFEDEDNNKPIEIKEPDVFYKGIKLKKTGEFGQNIEYSDGKGGKYEKHKFKAGAEVIKIQ
tara:strand:- start:750 stop:1547 length:798 start_codon:yes stop_codon:yes gene_type:complete